MLQNIYQQIKDGGVITLTGDLGAGKTTFVKKLAQLLGVDEFQVKSPTYNYIRQYPLSKDHSLFHLDLYRLEEIDEILLQEIEELYQNPRNIIAIEWPDRLGDHQPPDSIDLEIIYRSPEDREIRIQSPQ